MPYKILATKRIPGHRRGDIVSMRELDQFWTDQVGAGNAVVLSEPEPVAAPKPRKNAKKGASAKKDAKGKGAAKKEAVVEPDPED